ncbi:class I SAM-dependent methyltransferase [Candidatus Woesearchaeota archaeon]|nr:class I SAM-dependent methyltransferase [Candidatus Woesearchaeota archaeon]
MVDRPVELSKGESSKVIGIMESYLKNQILQSLGQREISGQDLHELTSYWIASTFSRYKPNDFETMSNEAIQDYFLSDYGKWDRGLESYTEMAGSSLVEIIDERIKRNGAAKVLDVGCGQAVFLKDLQNRYGDSVDCYGVSNINHEGIETIDFRLALAEILPEEWTDKFDLVTCFEASMYFWDQSKAFDEALRVINPNGELFYGTNNLKTHTADAILSERLDLDDFTYIHPETSGRAEEKYSGVWGKYFSNFAQFIEGMVALLDENEIFEKHGKKFDMKNVGVLAWCPTTLQVKGLGYAEK